MDIPLFAICTPLPTLPHAITGRRARHSSGPERIATPFSVEDLAQSLTSYFMPVLTGAFWTSLTARTMRHASIAS